MQEDPSNKPQFLGDQHLENQSPEDDGSHNVNGWKDNLNDARNFQFCGLGWDDTAANCSLDRHCPDFVCSDPRLACFIHLSSYAGAEACNAYKMIRDTPVSYFVDDDSDDSGYLTYLMLQLFKLPSKAPTAKPTSSPTKQPTKQPIKLLTNSPTFQPTAVSFIIH